MRKLFDLQHPFFRPLWRRVAVVALCAVWTGVELWRGSPGWAVVFAALAALCAWEFFVAFDPKDGDGDGGDG